MKESDFLKWAEVRIGSIIKIDKCKHGDRSNVYKLTTKNQKIYFLKIAKNLQNEYEKLIWLKDKQPCPEVIDFISKSSIDMLLLNSISGNNLSELSKKWSPEKVITKLVFILKQFHNTDISDWPFEDKKEGDVLIHGDFTFPNLIFNGEDFSGYIDLGDMSVGNIETDLSAALWSLDYNLGKGYGELFLKKYGIKNVTEELVEKLRIKYEDNWPVWFPEEYN